MEAEQKQATKLTPAQEFYTDYNKQLREVVMKNEEDFEKKIIYIASGALGLSLSFISNIVTLSTSSHKWMLVAGWVLLIVCILANLVSLAYAKRVTNKSIRDVYRFIGSNPNIEETELYKLITSRNKQIELVNSYSIIFLGAGICFIVLFTAINLLYPTETPNIIKQAIDIINP